MRKIKGHYFKWLCQYTIPYLPRIIFLLLIGLADSLITVGLAIVTKNIIDGAMRGGFLIDSIILYITMIISSLIISAVSSLINIVLDERFSFGIRKQLYEHIIHSHWMDVSKFHTGDLMTRLTSDAGNIANGIIYTIPNIIRLVIELLIMFGVLYYYQPQLAFISIVIAPVAALCCGWLGKKLKKLQIKVQETESGYRSFLQESLSNLLVIKAFRDEDYTVDHLVELREERFHWVKKKGMLGIASSSVMSFTFQLGYIIAFTFGSLQVSQGNITYGTMTVFLSLVSRIQSPIIQLAKNIPSVVSILSSTERIMKIQDLKEEQALPITMKTDEIGIHIENLDYGYLPEEKVLDKVSLTIQPGEFIAIIGESGIGKTTLIRLILSFMSNYEGSIKFTNNSGEDMVASAGARDFMSYVPQGNTLFSGTIRENVHMGRVDCTEDEIITALKMACVYEFVRELPNGLDTVIGERGCGLSEGQAQRIAIARALVRKSPLLILDEATSSLDEITELKVLEGIRQMAGACTCILITHRSSVLAYCDRQIMIENKKIKEKSLVK